MESSQRSIETRASVCVKCESCKKRERYRVIPVTDNLPNPVIILLAESPLAVMIKEVHTPNHNYLIFRCQDPMCLLANTRQSIVQYFFADQRRKMVAMQQQQAKHQRKHGTKRKHRKKKGK